jgi:hypothetical protein
MSLSRITITIPPELLAEADRRAEALDRSRSWLLTEAIRAYLEATPREGAGATPPPPTETPFVREPAVTYVAGLGPGRLGQLRADLDLDHEERVRVAQRAAALGPRRRRPSQRDRVIAFHRLEDYFVWERHEDLAPPS